MPSSSSSSLGPTYSLLKTLLAVLRGNVLDFDIADLRRTGTHVEVLLELVDGAFVTLCFTSHGAFVGVLDEAGEVEFVGLIGRPGAV